MSSLSKHFGENTLPLVAGFVVALVVGYLVLSTAVSPEFQNYVNDSAEWCEDHGGDLENSQSVAHGGLHCELPNGTTVHMSDVVTPRSESG